MHDDMFRQARILIVDDQEANVRLLERLLQRAGYSNVKSTTDPRQAVSRYIAFVPHLILLDLQMPHLDGFTVMEQLQPLVPEGTYLPILVLTADITREARQRALSRGAKDFVTKPFDHDEVLLRIRNLLEVRFLYLAVQNQNMMLEDRVRERTRELAATQMEILKRLARAAEYRDDTTGQHTQRVGRTAALLARALGLAEDQVELIRQAAPLHDVGKIGIPDHILLKPGKLTVEEHEQMQQHTTMGAALLAEGRFPLLELAEEIALTHHERWDGTGYPRGLAAEAIPLPGRIVALADVFDALTHDRPYKEAWPVEWAVAEVVQQQGRHFDPRVVDAFVQVQAREQLHELDQAAEADAAAVPAPSDGPNAL